MLSLLPSATLFLAVFNTIPNAVAASGKSVPFVPTVKNNEAESRTPTIRALLLPEHDRRQVYYCTAPKITCMTRYCCQDSSWNCCIDGSCCYPNYYCARASNGNIGCCPDGEVCSGPVDDPTTVGRPITITRTSTIRNAITSTRTLSIQVTTSSQIPLPPAPPTSSIPDPTTSTPAGSDLVLSTPLASNSTIRSSAGAATASVQPNLPSTGGAQVIGGVGLARPLAIIILSSALMMSVI
ncbi:hypothetical protein CVT24_007706 [Panaeolus cyanescens]|uniref:Granulins domain-containing protein n=1 Tax=Panaeolus cyanescens TaxID=181874 RepID=A0A409VRC9_9AGAR|nr:hypothetical protein CVT24_007706 [Panaeolus cyanescens]